MEWVLLFANVVLAGFLVHMWLNYQARANDLRRRQDAAIRRTEEHRQQIATTQQELLAVEAELPEIEALAGSLKQEVNKLQARLAKLEMIEGGQHPSQHQV